MYSQFTQKPRSQNQTKWSDREKNKSDREQE